MMGCQEVAQAPLFYNFNLDAHIPANHLLRGIDRFQDLSELHAHLAPHYSNTGRPSIDPALLMRMLVVGYGFGIRSERQLCDEVHLNLAYRWLCRLGLEYKVPDHSMFSKNRHGRFRDNDTLQYVFEKVLARCLTEGLVGGEGFAVDASVVRADASRQRSVPGAEAAFDRTASLAPPVREYLEALDAAEEPETPPKNVSLTDPAARWTAAPGGPAFYAYSTNYLIDVKAGVIVDVEATPAFRNDEVNSTKTIVDRVEGRFDLKPQRLIGDTAYGTAEMLGWMVDEKGIAPHTPVWDKTERHDVLTLRLRVAPGRRRVSLPRWQSAAPRLAQVQRAAHRYHQGQYAHLSCIRARLQTLRIESAVLPEHLGAQDHSARQRIGTRHGNADRQDACLCAITTAAQEGGSAVCAP